MNRLVHFFALFGMAMLLAGCQTESFEEEFPENPVNPVQFTLKATYGNPDGKASFDEDGLNMSWTEGDVLYLIDPLKRNPTVTLTSDITEPSKTAFFHTSEVVQAGEYIVLYGQNTQDVSKDIKMKAVSDPDNIAELARQVRLYGSLTVEQDQTSAEITLKQLYSMLTFKFKNVPTGGRIVTMGMAVASEGLKSLNKGWITEDGLDTQFGDMSFMTNFGWEGGKDSRTLIAPVDLSGKKVFFFAWGENAEGRHVNYEFAKDGINLKEGSNYNITLDFSNATVSTIYTTPQNAKILASPADFRAAAYWNSGLTFCVEKDIDFKGEAVFPIYAATLVGNGHTLSNINIDFTKCGNVGILSEGRALDLNVVSSSITGYSYVGGICGRGFCENCSCTSVKVSGEVEVGGLVGHAQSDIKNCSLLGQSSVKCAWNYVGGITGLSSYSVDSCLVKGTVQIEGAHAYVGGIAGRADGGVSVCGVQATVKGNGSYVGGVAGQGSCSRSFCYGDVTGSNNVGGVTGDAGEEGSCTDCYHIGSVTGANGATFVGGVSGSSWESVINNCYSYGTVSGGYGLCYQLDGACVATNLTSEARLSSNVESEDNCNCSPSKTFLSKISVLQGNSAYVKACWPDLNAGGEDPRCPLLAWQYDFSGSIGIPGFSDETW